MAKKKKLTPLQQEFKKEQTRIRNAQRRLEKQGFYFTENMIPPLPRRVTRKALQEIKDITRAELIRNALWVSRETGEVLGTGTQLERGRKAATRERRAAAGRKSENIQRLRDYAVKRAKIKPRPYEEVRREYAEDYYYRMQGMSAEYQDDVQAEWDKLWALLESRYDVEDIADAIAAAGGVPEPYGAYSNQQWSMYSVFANKLYSHLQRLGGDQPDIKEQLDNIDNAIVEDAGAYEEEYD